MRHVQFKLFLTLIVLLVFCCIMGPVAFADETMQNQDQEYSAVVLSNEQISDSVIDRIIIPLSMQFLGAFLGFLSAAYLSMRANWKQRKELDNSLHGEIVTIRDDLQKRLGNTSDSMWFQYSTTIWDISLASGSLALITNRKIFDKYIGIYSEIQYAQKLESEYTHSRLLQSHTARSKDSFLDMYIVSTNDERKKYAELILEKIEALLAEGCETKCHIMSPIRRQHQKK